eukprot:TRINITY_DN3628_c0_g1_i1.p1 TRINITY_DN3628_c0_g1~~TRINITY_DN3628_c0_g1_i1.p1  ORF type:complete len:328 (+),score=27.67 TRINITY_DN3628_c0_g1_i1:1056-2039(+)
MHLPCLHIIIVYAMYRQQYTTFTLSLFILNHIIQIVGNMLSPRKALDEDNLTQTYQSYKKWQHKRQAVKERMKERLNESLSPLKPTDSSAVSKTLLKRDISANVGGKKPSSIKERIQGITGGFPGKTLDLSSASAKTKSGEETGKKRFDDLLNNYFSALPSTLSTTVSSPIKGHTRSQKKMQNAMDAIKSGFRQRSPSSKTLDKTDTLSNMYKTNYVEKKPSFISLNDASAPKLYSSKPTGFGLISAVNTIQYPQTARNAPTTSYKQQLLSEEVRKLQAHVEKMSAGEYAALPVGYQDELARLAQSILFKQKMSQMSLKSFKATNQL